jgi:hypothetical protein
MSNARVRKKDVLPSGQTQPQQQRQQQQQYIHVLSNTLTLIPKWGGYYSFWTLLQYLMQREMLDSVHRR